MGKGKTVVAADSASDDSAISFGTKVKACLEGMGAGYVTQMGYLGDINTPFPVQLQLPEFQELRHVDPGASASS